MVPFMAVSDDKQNRLSGLSQDVIAVTRKTPPGSVPAPRSVRRTGEHQASDHGSASTPAVSRLPTGSEKAVASTAALPGPALRGAVWGAVIVSVAALLIATYAITLADGLPVAGGADTVARLDADLKAVTARMALLEAVSHASTADAGAGTGENGAAARTNPQLSTALHAVRNDLDKLTAELAALTVQGSVKNGELRVLAGSASKDGKMALARIDQLSAQLATFTEQVRGIQRSGGAGGGSVAAGDSQAQIQALSRKTDMMAADIRQLYRQLENRRP